MTTIIIFYILSVITTLLLWIKFCDEIQVRDLIFICLVSLIPMVNNLIFMLLIKEIIVESIWYNNLVNKIIKFLNKRVK